MFSAVRRSLPKDSPWVDVASGTAKSIHEEIQTGRMSLRAGGLAFFAFLSIFPALGLLGALYGLFFSREQLTAQLKSLSDVIPGGVSEGLVSPLRSLLEIDAGTLEIGAIVSILTMVWSARRGSLALLRATNLAYEIDKQRSLLKLTGAAIIVSGVVLLGVAITVASLSLLPWLLDTIGFSGRSRGIVDALRWPAVYLALTGFISFVYWYGPNRSRPAYRWTLPAAGVVAGLLLLTSWLMTLAVASVLDQREIYGPVASVATLLLWLYVTSWILLMGAEFSHRVECAFAEAQLPR